MSAALPDARAQSSDPGPVPPGLGVSKAPPILTRQEPCLPHCHLPAERLRGLSFPKSIASRADGITALSQGLQMCVFPPQHL